MQEGMQPTPGGFFSEALPGRRGQVGPRPSAAPETMGREKATIMLTRRIRVNAALRACIHRICGSSYDSCGLGCDIVGSRLPTALAPSVSPPASLVSPHED